ncbi:TPA: hypothetical protein ACGVYF_001342 [Enterococcus faecium]|uniref:hypothetical protein n=1 Tax=Enterococcus TaxID=1350 RepID=UPI000763E072|nr:hypothetical protein [Enterococcus faecium]MBU5530603.1 hypothetical protein [Enterococcus sp. S109_ASV_20]EKC6789327.1 hypothetical protein [Enterococcus faecium]EKZ0061628.1 hypothetical protein [Enterococcus faecium]KAB7590460.1 hypothetical protein GBM52_13890 [Enterococcus faecium]KWY08407.1 hypothetical protein AS227_10025 [Enterococcus faecium]
MASWLIEEIENERRKIMDAGITVMLDKQQTNQLKNYVFEMTKEAIDQARIDAGLERPFLKGKEMAKYLNVSYTTFLKFKRMGLPVILLEKMELFSKEECKKWILSHQI